jgi:integrase
MVRKGNNPHHPMKGSTILVQPIRQIEDIEAIIELLKDKPRDKLLFILGINNGLRVGDLLKLKVGDVRHLREGGFFIIREGKTGKKNYLYINADIAESLKEYLRLYKPKSKEWLFPSQKGNKPLTVQAVNNMIKRWGEAVGIIENLGAHTLRKTFGYHQRLTYNTPIELITKRYKHSSPAVTMSYLGIEETEVLNIMKNNIGKRPEGGQNV